MLNGRTRAGGMFPTLSILTYTTLRDGYNIPLRHGNGPRISGYRGVDEAACPLATLAVVSSFFPKLDTLSSAIKLGEVIVV